MGDPRVPDNRHAADILLGLRFRLDLYVNYRPVRLFHEKLCPLKGVAAEDVDFVVFRENTEGLYVMMGGNFKKDTAGRGGHRGRPQHAQGRGAHRPPRLRVRARPRAAREVAMADKSNVLIHAHDLWQRVFKAVAAEYPGIEASHLYVDNLALQMVRDPRAVPGDRDLEHVRRHRHRPGRGAAGRAGHGGLGQHPSRPAEPLRARPRLVAAATRARTSPTRWARS